MIYEIGWTRHDISDFIVMACFIPLLIGFIIFIKNYKTEKDNFQKDSMISIGGSKNHNNTYNKDLEQILDKNIKDGKEYTIYFTCDYSYDSDYIILRIDSK